MTEAEKLTRDLQGAVLGLCNPLLDISSDVPMSLLERYGVSLNNAILAEEKHLGLFDEIVNSFPVKYIAGGAGLNSIRVTQWMLQIPGVTSYMGAVGCDEYANILEECATKDGVLVNYMKNPEVATGTCVVLINSGERSLVTNLAAANTFTFSHLETPESQAIINRAKIFYITGFFMTVSMESILYIAKHAVDNDKMFSMNLSAPFLIQYFVDQLSACIPYCDIIFSNESEAACYGEAKGYGTDLKQIALKLAAQPKASGCRPRIVVFTQGSGSTIVAKEGVVTEYPVTLLARELLVDTNGAGDAFVGGFLSQLVLGKSMDDCVRAGHFAARVIIQHSGCTFPPICEYA